LNLIALLQSPLLPVLAFGVATAAWLMTRPSARGRIDHPDDDEGRLSDDEVKVLIDRAIEAKKKKDHLRAGWFYEQGNLWIKAAECYETAGDAIWAAELFQRGGDHRRSGELYRLNGHALEAATVLELGGHLGDAGVNYAVAGDVPRAARLFEEAGRQEEAAELYFKLGGYHQAGKLFAEAGNRRRAADAYERMVETLGGRTLEADVQIARILEKEKRHEATVRFLEAVGEVLGGLRAAIRYGLSDEALRLYREYRDILAGPLLKGAKEGKLSASVLADLFEQAGDFVPAARMARTVGQWHRVAKLYEQAGDDARAAGAWERAGEVREAALCYERAGVQEKAAKLFEEGGETVRAVHCYNQAAQHFDSGRLYDLAGEVENAIAAFEKVGESHVQWRKARLRLGHLERQAGRPDVASRIFEDALSRTEPQADDADDLIALAQLLRGQQRYGEAAATWAAVGALDSGREGVTQALSKLASLARDHDQPVPESYPYTPARPAPEEEAATEPMMPALDGARRGFSGTPGKGLPAGVTMNPIVDRPVSMDGDAKHDDVLAAGTSLDDGFGAMGSGLVPKESLVSFEAFADGFSDESLVGADTSEEIDTAVGESPAPDASSEGVAEALPEPTPLEMAETAKAPPDPARAESSSRWDIPEMAEEPLEAGARWGSGEAQESWSPDGGPGEDWAARQESDDEWAADGSVANAWDATPEDGSSPIEQASWTQFAREGATPVLEKGDEPVGRPEFGPASGDDLSWSGSLDSDEGTGWRPPPGESTPADPAELGFADPTTSGVLSFDDFGTEAAPAGSPLDAVEAFRVLERPEKALVEQFLDFRALEAGEPVLTGDPEADGLVLLVEGEVDVQTPQEAPRRHKAVALLAAQTLLLGELPDLRIIARTPVQCWILSRLAARKMAERNREVALRLARALRSL
jgi:tetratricopeptide (TPR) repeat protein